MKAFSEYFPPLFLLLNGGIYCVIAWLFAHDPNTWYAAVSIQLISPEGYTELNSIYVGLLAGTGLFLLIATMVEGLQYGATAYLMFSYCGLAAARGWGIFVTGQYNDLMLQLFLAEALSAAAAVVALYCLYLGSLRRRNPYF